MTSEITNTDSSIDAMMSHLDDCRAKDQPDEDADEECTNCALPPEDRRVERRVDHRGTTEHPGKATGWRQHLKVVRSCPECGETYLE